MQKTTFLKINGFGVKYFIKSKYRRIQTGLAILKTSNQNIKMSSFKSSENIQKKEGGSFDFFQTTDFLCNFQKSHFFRDF